MKELLRDALLLAITIILICAIYIIVAESDIPLWLKLLILK